MEKYPKEIHLKTRETLIIRPMEKDDLDALIAFFQSLPREDRMYLRSDVKQKEMMDMNGIFSMEKLKEGDINEILKTGDIFAIFEKVKPKKKKIITPKPKSRIPRKMTYWELMDYLEYVIEFEQGKLQSG